MGGDRNEWHGQSAAAPVPSTVPPRGAEVGAKAQRPLECFCLYQGGRKVAWQPSARRGQSGGDASSAAALTGPPTAAQTGVPPRWTPSMLPHSHMEIDYGTDTARSGHGGGEGPLTSGTAAIARLVGDGCGPSTPDRGGLCAPPRRGRPPQGRHTAADRSDPVSAPPAHRDDGATAFRGYPGGATLGGGLCLRQWCRGEAVRARDGHSLGPQPHRSFFPV